MTRQHLAFEFRDAFQDQLVLGLPTPEPAPAPRARDKQPPRFYTVRCPWGDHTALITRVGGHLFYARHTKHGSGSGSCPIGGLDTADAAVPWDSRGRLPRPECVCPTCKTTEGDENA